MADRAVSSASPDDGNARGDGHDPETARLAWRLARALRSARGTSKFAVRAFLEAVEDPEVIAAETRLVYEKKAGRIEASLHIGPDLDAR